ncbi:MAG: hypothetical protein B7Z55_01285 [Planctomycetales bacterium 12-60-4]|nr:MAG: hypothetical protein B7Z55_01285 [Planctomycetales bacterium 12-60-4]
MIPPWLRLALYVAAGVAGVWLLFRAWQSRRLTKQNQPFATARGSTSKVPVTTTPAPVPAADPTSIHDTAPVTPSTAVDQLTILKSGVSLTAPQLVSAAPENRSNGSSSVAAPAWRPSAWADRPLLSEPQATTQGLPLLRAEDVPLTREDDFVFGGVTPTLAAFLPDSPTRFEESRKELQAAGYYQPHAMQNLAAVRYVMIMLGLVIAGFALLLAPAQWEWIAVAGLIALPLLGWALPRLYIRGQAAERRSEIERGMPDLLDMLNMCVSQGLTIPDSLRRILPDLRGPYPALAQELRIVDQQASIGNMQTALENFSHRIDIPEVHSFASLLTQTERMGTSISDALTSYSDTMRESLKQRAEEKGNRATFRLLFPTVLCLMPAVYLFLLGPAIVELSNFFSRGGRDSLDQGSAVIQRINEARGVPGPLDANP